MMKYVNGKRMEESDLCMMLEDMGVVLDRPTWTHLKEVFDASQKSAKSLPKGKNSSLIYMLKRIVVALSKIPAESQMQPVGEGADSEGSDKQTRLGK